MKNIFMKFIAATLLLVAVSPLQAQAAATVYKNDTVSRAAIATQETAKATNVSPTEVNQAGKSLSDHPPVRIDKTSIHISGPMGIDVPDFPLKGEGLVAIMAMLVPIVGILAPFIFIVVALTVIFHFRHRRSKMLHETLRAMVDKGVPITPELVAQLKGKSSRGSKAGGLRSGLLPGLVLAGIGTALLITGSGHSTGGWIVLFIGIAFLIVWFVERKNQNNVQPPQ